MQSPREVGCQLIITPDPELRKQALEALQTEYKMANLRPGLHQSELSYCLTKAYWDRISPLPLTEKETLLFAIGFGMERVILAREESPSELVLDGISCSLDTIRLFGPADLKTTRKRAAGRKGEDGFQIPEGWKHQFLAYRHALNQLTDNVGHDFAVICVHLVEPEISAYRFQFSDEEMEQNWARLLDRSNQLESMVAAGNPMPFTTNEDWECEYCRYKLQCDLAKSIERIGR